jgi:prepilin-type N-terminal cleavage/methylation domain-containing protein
MAKVTREKQQSGFTLLELMIAMAIAAVGLLAVLGLFIIAIANNSRSKRDTTATLLSQSVLEQILQGGTNSLATITMSDCVGNTWTVNINGGTGTGAGASVDSAGNIDFSAAAPSNNYAMTYAVCRANGQVYLYDVRWNILDLDVSGPTIYTRLARVSARPIGTNRSNAFVLPITLRGVVAVAED